MKKNIIPLLKTLSPGTALAALTAYVAWFTAQTAFCQRLGLGPVILAVVLGILIKNTLGVKQYMQPGVKFCAKKVLRAAIVLLGFKLSLTDVSALGLQTTLFIVLTCTGTLLVTKWLGKKMGISNSLSLLIGAGCSICGASAVMAVDAVTPKAKEEDAAFAVAVVTVFGTLFMFLYPLLFKLLGMSETFYALWTGLSVHEVAQAVAAGFAVSPQAGAMATIAKLSRVLFLLPLTFFLVFQSVRREGKGAVSFKKVPVPWFVLFFFGVILINSLGWVPTQATGQLIILDNMLMAAAMAALGLETSFSSLKKAGVKPLYLGAAASAAVALLSAGLLWTGL